MKITAFSLAQRFAGEVVELPGDDHSPFIQWCHQSCRLGHNAADEIPWCSSFVNRIAWILRLPRSKSARARSWLEVGRPLHILEDPEVGFDIVVLQRGGGNQPGPEVLEAPGHVGFYAGREDDNILVLGGNQGDAVSIRPFPLKRLLGYRRVKE